MGWIAGKAGQSPAARSDYYIAYEDFVGVSFPIFVLVRHAPQATTDRPQAPPPSNGFKCEKSPFDRGHVCALELGGPDIPLNIVPQWRHWQETGGWRQMEASRIPQLSNAGDLLLFQVVWMNNLKFNGEPPQVDASHYRLFETESLIEWEDYRIPVAFRCWHLPKLGKAHKNLTDSLGTADQRSDIVEALKTLGAPTITMEQGSMPAEDHSQLECQQLVAATGEFCSLWEGEHERRFEEQVNLVAKERKLNKRQAALEARKIIGAFSRSGLMSRFGESHAKVFQQLLLERFNFDANEIAHFTASRILAAHGNGYPRVALKKIRPKSQAKEFMQRRGAAKAREKSMQRLRELASDAMDVDQ